MGTRRERGSNTSSEKVNDMGDVSGAVVADFSVARNVKMKLTGDVSLTFNPPSAEAGVLFIIIQQDFTGGRTVTFPPILGLAPSLSLLPEAKTVIPIYFDGLDYHTIYAPTSSSNPI